MSPRIGTAGWSLPSACSDHFPEHGTSLERYSARFSCAEINSSFHRSHRPSTYERWAASVPDGFRFSAKLPKTITHQSKLVDCEELIDRFVEEVQSLGTKLAILLVQLPPSLAFDRRLVAEFFALLAARTPQQLVCEPRHASWFEGEADELLDRLRIARVAGDPAKPGGERPGGWRGLSYYRWHGSPRMYRSSYDDGRLEQFAAEIGAERDEGRPVWSIFDNTASSAAASDALKLQALTSR